MEIGRSQSIEETKPKEETIKSQPIRIRRFSVATVESLDTKSNDRNENNNSLTASSAPSSYTPQSVTCDAVITNKAEVHASCETITAEQPAQVKLRPTTLSISEPPVPAIQIDADDVEKSTRRLVADLVNFCAYQAGDDVQTPHTPSVPVRYQKKHAEEKL
jgi:hypothetical protein